MTGLVLSGSLSDGTAGLCAIKRCGGTTVVQDPDEAIVPSMPRNALRYAEIDYVRPVAEMANLFARLALKADERLGTISPFTCPECHGALWEIRDGSMLRFRCHVGHAFTADAVLEGRTDEVDRMLGSLQRAHQERAALMRRMADLERAGERHNLADRLEARAREYEDDARLVMGLIRNGFGGTADNERSREHEGDG